MKMYDIYFRSNLLTSVAAYDKDEAIDKLYDMLQSDNHLSNYMVDLIIELVEVEEG